MGMKMLLIVVFMSATILTGCMNISGHIDDKPYKPYESTKSAYKGLVEVFSIQPEWHGGSQGEAAIAHAYAVIAAPFILVTCIVEPIADTLTLPYDWYAIKKSEVKQ